MRLMPVPVDNPVAERELLDGWNALYERRPGQLNEFNGADAELLPLGEGVTLAATVDTVEEEIRIGLYDDPEQAGWVAAAAALSDLAAVGAAPTGLLVSVTLPGHDELAVQRRVGEGIEAACRHAGTYVLGGDTNSGDRLSIACTALGTVHGSPLLTRQGARPGDAVFATRPLGRGGAYAASRLLGDERAFDFRPRPRLREGALLRGVASSCMDTSDGLLATVGQLAALNRVGIDLRAPATDYIDPDAMAAAAAAGLPVTCLLASHHGEFELVFTVPPGNEAELARRAGSLGWVPRRIGRVCGTAGVRLGDAEVPTDQIAELAAGAAGNPVRYARALAGLCTALERGSGSGS